MEWGILAVSVIFVVVGYIVLQGTRASGLAQGFRRRRG
jgi:hypothetical protein